MENGKAERAGKGNNSDKNMSYSKLKRQRDRRSDAEMQRYFLNKYKGQRKDGQDK